MTTLKPTLKICDIPDEDEKLIHPLHYFEKNQRHILVGLLSLHQGLNNWCKIPREIAEKLFYINQLTTRQIIILDDICDNASLRMGKPPAHLIYGIPNTICAIRYGMAHVLTKLIEFEDLRCIDLTIEHTIKSLRGNGFEIYFRNRFKCPTEEEYFNLVMPKTYSFVLAGCQMLQLFSENKEDYSKYVIALTTAMQLANDYFNLQSSSYSSEKGGFGEDITTGTFTFPLIHAIQSHPKNSKVLLILKRRTKSNVLKQYCVKLLNGFGSFDYTKMKVKQLLDETAIELKKLPNNSFADEMMNLMLKSANLEEDSFIHKLITI